ncbi:hypothetical protein BJX76DRAFT_98789 [Aspergillus varians]
MAWRLTPRIRRSPLPVAIFKILIYHMSHPPLLRCCAAFHQERAFSQHLHHLSMNSSEMRPLSIKIHLTSIPVGSIRREERWSLPTYQLKYITQLTEKATVQLSATFPFVSRQW